MRNSNGTPKEHSIMEEVLDKLFFTQEFLKVPDIRKEKKLIMENMEGIINGIKALQDRKYV
jgi:hypothetical protein